MLNWRISSELLRIVSSIGATVSYERCYRTQVEGITIWHIVERISVDEAEHSSFAIKHIKLLLKLQTIVLKEQMMVVLCFE